MLILIILLALLYSSLVEYCVHRFILHRSYKEEHIRVHHKVFHGIKSYELEEVNSSDILSSAGEILRNAMFYMPPTVVVFIQSKVYGIIFLAVCFIYNFWEEFIHLNFHKKRVSFVTKSGVFKRLKEHHRVHHYIYNSNYGIGTSLWDIVFNTKKHG